MLAYIVLLLAILSRILPAFHSAAWNFTALGGGLLFFGSRLRGTDSSRGFTRAAALRLASAVAVLAAADYFLTVVVYRYPFLAGAYLVTWLWYAAVCLLGMGLLEKITTVRVLVGALATSTSFFLISNFMFWLGGPMSPYPHTLAGLEACYVAAIPFYRNDLVSTAIVAGALFGLPVLAARIAESLHTAQNQPLA